MKRNMMRRMKILTASAVVVAVAGLMLPSETSFAQASQIQSGVDSIADKKNAPLSTNDAIRKIINTLLFIIGTLAVIMIIFGGFKYVTSAGEASAVSSAKNTILYAVIGLVVAILAFAIVDFVLDALNSSTNTQQASPRADPRLNRSPNDPNYIGPTP